MIILIPSPNESNTWRVKKRRALVFLCDEMHDVSKVSETYNLGLPKFRKMIEVTCLKLVTD